MSANQRMRTMRRMSNRMEAYVARHRFNAKTFKANNKKAPKLSANVQKMLKALGKSVVKKQTRAKSMKPNMNLEQNKRKSLRLKSEVNRLAAATKEKETARLIELAAKEAERAARVKDAKQENALVKMMEGLEF